MGEFSKRIGEVGEDIVQDFLRQIGWINLQRNFDIPSTNPEKHGKHSHGIDAYFHYRSPMITNTIENVLISIKFSIKPYPNSPSAKFKEYYLDLGIAIESFKKSALRVDTLNNHETVESVFDRGVIFWLNNLDSSPDDLFYKLAGIEAPADIYHDGIFLVDNKRAEFIYNTIQYCNLRFNSSLLEFSYFPTGLNNNDTSIRNGAILPVQYINASILPIRVQDLKTDDTTFLLSTIERFEQVELIKLMGLAKNIASNFQGKTVIAFPDFNVPLHEQAVANTKQIFGDNSFTKNVEVVNFNISFKN